VKKVGLFTTFYEAESGYSLIAVAETQLRMLLDHGYDPAVLVQENFTEPAAPSVWRKEMIDLRPSVPFLHLESGVAKDFEQRVKKIQDALSTSLMDVEVCITHDVVLQSFYKEHNVAMRRYAKTRPDLLWLHWIHSCPTPGQAKYPENCRYTSPPGYIIYPNSSDLSMVCRTYGLHGKEWKAIANRSGHAIDPLAVWPYDELTKDLIDKSGHLAGDVTAVYPVRLDRGKQPEKIIRLLAGIYKLGYDPRLLVIDWQSTGQRFQKYIDELLQLADELGLSGRVNFTSRLDDRCSQGVPRQVVMELMDLSNVYIHPSRIETYSLTVHEAMLRGCLCVLNHDLPVMRELWGDNALYMDFESDRVTDRKYTPSEQAFWNDEALRLMSELKQNRAAMAKTTARKKWTPQAMWPEFAPLLALQPVGEG
jgi:glycosyltransferase involved in cell wall biosynthesis